jgi:hypothetical protein
VNEKHAGQVIRQCLSSSGRINNCVSQLLRLAGAGAGANRSHWLNDSYTASVLPLRTSIPEFSAKKSLLQLAGVVQIRVQKTYLFPSTTFFLLSITSCRITFYTALFYSSTLHFRFVALHPPSSNHPSRSHTVGIANTDRHQTYIQSRCTLASALVVGTHSLARGQHTQWTVGRRLTPSCRAGTVGFSKNQLRKWFDLRA